MSMIIIMRSKIIILRSYHIGTIKQNKKERKKSPIKRKKSENFIDLTPDLKYMYSKR